MLQIIKNVYKFYNDKSRWWLPLITGIPFSLCLPPFNHEFHFAFSLFPFLSFVSLLPFFFFATRKPIRRALWHTYLYSYTVALGQVFWIAFVTIEGLWVLIIAGMILLAAYVALFYLLAGVLFRWCYKKFKVWYVFVFPSCWILIDYLRSLGEMSFPWGFLGYIFTPLLPVSQFASITGVWGITYIIVFGNLLAWKTLKDVVHGGDVKKNRLPLALFTSGLILITVWGWWRIHNVQDASEVRVTITQPALDYINWGNHSIDSAFALNESLFIAASHEHPDFIVGPESALLCFLSRQSRYRNRILELAELVNTPLILGSLHWDKPTAGSVYDYFVYNTAFMIDPDIRELSPYRKIKLVPFSEAIPFEGIFPILSQVNLGEADFQRGAEQTIFSINDSIKVAPFICYESIYPDFVRKRLAHGANLIVHITNDGWFGKTTGPYQHATMARMRVIENGVAMVRCANTGISMFVDPVGRVLKQIPLSNRAIITGQIPIRSAETFYSRYGDWFIILCAISAGATALWYLIGLAMHKKKNKEVQV